jgi:hypothetical protein
MDLVLCALIITLGLLLAAGCRWSWFLTPAERALANGSMPAAARSENYGHMRT